MPLVTLNDPPRITLMPDQVAALGLAGLPAVGAAFRLTADAVVESTSIPGLRPEGDAFALRLRLTNVNVEAGA